MNRTAKVAVGIVIVMVISASWVQADTIFSDDFSGPHPGEWFIGHDGVEGSYSWAWPYDYAHEYADQSGALHYYPGDLHDYMERRNVELSGYSRATLSFYYCVDSEETNDCFTVNVRDQNGQWHELFRESGITDPLVWSYKEIDLSQFAGQTGLYVQFRFDSNNSDNGSSYDGAYVDLVVLTASNLPTITDISPSKASAGTDTEVTITGSNFGSSQGTGKVEFYYKSGQPKIEAPVTSWSDSEIVCKVPVATVGGYLASASSGPVTVTTTDGTSNGYIFKVTFGYGQIQWANPIVSYRINESTGDCTGESAAVQAAADSWSNAGASFTLKYAGTHTNNTASFDSNNDIMWGTTNPSASAEGSTWYDTVTGEILECDIVFNDSLSWDTSGSPGSGEYDVQTIALHELGHWLELTDLYGDIGDGECDSEKVMYGFGSPGVVKRNLHPDDSAGIVWIYGASSTVQDNDHDDDNNWWECFIATAAFGSPMESHVNTLRTFRDNYLLPCGLGRVFVRTYCKYSPPFAQFIAKRKTLRAVVRIGLMPLVGVSYSMLHFGPTITLTMLIGFLVIPILLVSFFRRKAHALQ